MARLGSGEELRACDRGHATPEHWAAAHDDMGLEEGRWGRRHCSCLCDKPLTGDVQVDGLTR